MASEARMMGKEEGWGDDKWKKVGRQLGSKIFRFGRKIHISIK